MTQITDVKAALIEILKADADTAEEVGTRVFGDELPRGQTASMPRKCIVIRSAGGVIPTWAAFTLPLEVQRVDLLCYGETQFAADEVRRAAFGAMRAIQRKLSNGVLVHWAQPAGGAAHGRDGPDSDWPFKWNSYQVMSDERAAS